MGIVNQMWAVCAFCCNAKLNTYADDHQTYSSNLDPLAPEKSICQEVNVTNQWYKNNGMIVNEKKHQALILEKLSTIFVSQ